MKKIKIGIVGVGYLGEFHVKQLKSCEDAETIGIYDINQHRASSISKKYNVPAFISLNKLMQKCNAISIVTPTNTHASIALKAINTDCHLFIEKPIANSVKNAEEILNHLKIKERVVHIGHIERYNPAFENFIQNTRKPIFIECHRLTTLQNRGLDVSVILDLMIHDIDLILQLVNSPIKKIIADGVSVISNNIDLATARLVFKNNCIANLTASRISNKGMRKIRVFEKNKYSSLNLLKKTIDEYKINKSTNNDINVKHNSQAFANEDALKKELEYFLFCVKNKIYAQKNMHTAYNALKIAIQINDSIQNNNK